MSSAPACSDMHSGTRRVLDQRKSKSEFDKVCNQQHLLLRTKNDGFFIRKQPRDFPANRQNRYLLSINLQTEKLFSRQGEKWRVVRAGSPARGEKTSQGVWEVAPLSQKTLWGASKTRSPHALWAHRARGSTWKQAGAWPNKTQLEKNNSTYLK